MLSRDEALAVTLSIAVALLIVILAVIAARRRRSAARDTGRASRIRRASEWTDSCVVCARTPEGLACSTPGIACVERAALFEAVRFRPLQRHPGSERRSQTKCTPPRGEAIH